MDREYHHSASIYAFFRRVESTNPVSFTGERAQKKRKREYPGDPADGSIPKPKGTAGKGGDKGYNLQSAMGLNDGHATYLWLLVSHE